ncbi:DinB family protein [Actinacidiphila acididurans]|uniref:DinB family protein n=1 Tax=Actinacidiphila acididurans TaxID=2784346 RepID=A0ABS2U0S8_9ACTN|nr:DinB family protein [Actinacidiphila acididurans]MBM9508642.1 DinB family protein [Actinacidiphila acididurans]
MPSLVDEVGDERGALLAFLEAQRGGLRRAVRGLTDEQAAAHPSVSAMALGGLVKHAAHMEHHWIQEVLGGATDARSGEAGWEAADWNAEFQLLPGETLAGVLADFAAVARATERAVTALPSLDVLVPLPQAPWFPPDAKRTARWILLHLVEEQARHAGHADIIRESLDGAVAFQLLADEQREQGEQREPEA